MLLKSQCFFFFLGANFEILFSNVKIKYEFVWVILRVFFTIQKYYTCDWKYKHWIENIVEDIKH